MDNKTTPNRTFVGGGLGGALGVVAVVMLPKFTALTFTPDEAAIMTAALGIIFGWLVRYLPAPRTGP